MSKYVANTEELQKAIALLTHIDGKLNDLSKRITAAYYQLDGQKSSAVDRAMTDIKTQGKLYDAQWENILAIKSYLEVILEETLATQQKAKTTMESEEMPKETVGGQNGNVSGIAGTLGAGVLGGSSQPANGKLKNYQNNPDYNWSPYGGETADYSDFDVLNGFKYEYCMRQKYYEQNVLFVEGACTVTSDCIAASVVRGYKVEPTRNDWKYGSGAKWTYCDAIPNTKYLSVEAQCKEICNQISNGNPVVIRVALNASDSEGHSVTAIGLREGANPNNITPADILVSDPGDGKIKTADQIYQGWYANSTKLSMQNGMCWSLIIPK